MLTTGSLLDKKSKLSPDLDKLKLSKLRDKRSMFSPDTPKSYVLNIDDYQDLYNLNVKKIEEDHGYGIGPYSIHSSQGGSSTVPTPITPIIPPTSEWILATGFWNDAGIWIDTENWID